MESAMLGTIPIAPKVGGIEEILFNFVGKKYLFDPKDLKSLINGLKVIISSDPYDIINDGIKLRESILLKFRNEIILNKLLKLFIDCC
jgi:mRNA-degrading endonuclease HigB of HigAB toxin-antitoxin module